jgi:hypothetical protein
MSGAFSFESPWGREKLIRMNMKAVKRKFLSWKKKVFHSELKKNFSNCSLQRIFGGDIEGLF